MSNKVLHSFADKSSANKREQMLAELELDFSTTREPSMNLEGEAEYFLIYRNNPISLDYRRASTVVLPLTVLRMFDLVDIKPIIITQSFFLKNYFKIRMVQCYFTSQSQRKVDVLMLSVLAAAPASLCQSNDADSAVVMTFPHRHANVPRSLWPAVSLSPTIRPGLANKLPAWTTFRHRGASTTVPIFSYLCVGIKTH